MTLPSKYKLKLPSKYHWVLDLDPLPFVIRECIKLHGTQEVAGDGNNPVILQWAKEAGGWEANYYTKDSIPWCGLAVAIVCKRAGKSVVKNYLRALSWAAYGKTIPASEAGLGDILVFLRAGGGHVGFYLGEDDNYYYAWGGNQSNQFNISKIAKARLYSVQRHEYKNKPKTVKKYFLDTGELVTINEA